MICTVGLTFHKKYNVSVFVCFTLVLVWRNYTSLCLCLCLYTLRNTEQEHFKKARATMRVWTKDERTKDSWKQEEV